jgi:hypothetical protein
VRGAVDTTPTLAGPQGIDGWFIEATDGLSGNNETRELMAMNASSIPSLRSFGKAASPMHRLQRPEELCFELLSSSGILLWAESMGGDGCRDQVTQ